MNHVSFRRVVSAVYVAATLCLIAAAPASALQIESFTTVATNPDGSVTTGAGAHPYELITDIHFDTKLDGSGNVVPVENLKDLRIDLPRGFVGDPSVAPACLIEKLQLNSCADESQVGVVGITQAVGFNFTNELTTPLYRITARPGAPAEFGFQVGYWVVRSKTFVRTGGDYGLSFRLRDIPEPTAILSTRINLWGVPSHPSHDVDRGAVCFNNPLLGKLCVVAGGRPSKAPARPFLTMPADCSAGPLVTHVTADSWQAPNDAQTATASSELPDGTPVGVTDCDRLTFPASLKAKPAQPQAAAPSPYVIDLDVAQNDNPTGLATPPLKKAEVALPEGTTINPSAATGLGACTPAQIALDSAADDSCPASSRIGDVTVTTPLLDDPMKGAIYLAKPHDNPTNSLMSIYLSIKGSGVLLKLPGSIALNDKTGQLTATFDNNPQLPFSNLHMEFRGGDRAPLANPATCGTKTTVAKLTSWSGQVTESTSTFDISADGQGAACPPAKFSPKLETGVTNPVAGASSPYTFRLTRDDTDAELASVQMTLPDGMLANVKDVTLCGEAQSAAGTCGADSLIGHVEVASGAGGSPFFLEGGRVYFTGPYRGAPFGLSIVVPVLAGPFDLGTVVVRAALSVDPATAAVTVTTDPLPTMLQGIPLKIRDLRLTIDRAGFMINPTSCAERTVNTTVGSTAGGSATVGNRFEVGECAALPLRPKLTMALEGPTKKGGNPTLKAHLTQQAEEANLRKAVVKLPKVVGFDIRNNKSVCMLDEMAKNACPAASRVGTASVRSVLHDALTGPVYLTENTRINPKTGKSAGGLPGLFLPVSAEGVTLNLKASTDIAEGRLITTFDDIPDAPIVSFDLSIDGGKGSILVLAKDLCETTPTAVMQADGQNGKIADGGLVASTPCTLRKLGQRLTSKRLTLKLGGVGSGKVTIKGSGLRTTTRTLKSASVASVTAPLTLKSQRAMRRGTVKRLAVQVRFEPKTGAAVTRRYTVRVKPKR